MRRFLFLGLIILINLLSLSRAQGYQLPICSSDEFIDTFNLVADFQMEIAEAPDSFSDLLLQSVIQIDHRENSLSQLPQCAVGIAARDLLIRLGGDVVGRAALDMAGLPPERSPYRQRLASDQDRLEEMLSGMLDVDYSQALSSEEQSLPQCEGEDIDALAATLTAALQLLETTALVAEPAQYIASVDQRLAWREENLALLPECGEAIEVGTLVSALVTDAAARHALSYAELPDALNPYIELEAAGIASLEAWGEGLRTIDSGNSATTITELGGSVLPACTLEELSSAYDSLAPVFRQLLENEGMASSLTDLLEFSGQHVALREASLPSLPICAEAFEAGWRLGEALGDAVVKVSLEKGASSTMENLVAERMESNQARATAVLEEIQDKLGGGQSSSVTIAQENAQACSDAETTYLLTYLVPEFGALIDAALAVTDADDSYNLIEPAYKLRDMLWVYLPRCAEALDIGLIMRQVAADFVAALALETAGASAQEIPYVWAIAAGLQSYYEWLNEVSVARGFALGSNNIYYVVAEGIANVRSCGSTDCDVLTTVQRGQTLDVLDDLSSWYQIRLTNDETGYIASFLVSKSPPGP